MDKPFIYWRSVIVKLTGATVLLLGVLVMIFVLMDFSENSDDFTDNGAPIRLILGVYYLNYIPEMIRLVLPVAIFVGTLFLAGRWSERLEFTAYRAAGVPERNLIAPFLFFGMVSASLLSSADAFLIPESNLKRFDFERQYLSGKSERLESGVVFRQESEQSILNINFYDAINQYGYQMQLMEFEEEALKKWTKASRMIWIDSLSIWRLRQVEQRIFDEDAYLVVEENLMDTTLSILPEDLLRRSNDMYQLNYPEALHYLQSLERLGIGDLQLPVVQFFGRLFYPLSIIIVSMIGFTISTGSQRHGGRGFQIAMGLVISFVYLTLMKIAEPFGAEGIVHPAIAAFLPHGFFLLVALAMMTARRFRLLE